MKIIEKQTEANYQTDINNCISIETIFELADGRFYHGCRRAVCYNSFHNHTTQNPNTFRKHFLNWLKQDDPYKYDPYEFSLVNGINFQYN